MASNQGRSVFKSILTNFLNSLRLLPPKGKIMGQDHIGNSYYEAPNQVHSHRKSPVRWFVPAIKDDWQQDLPAEWEAWLRGRRKDPPTVEEVQKNLAISNMKKQNAKELEEKAEMEKQKNMLPQRNEDFSRKKIKATEDSKETIKEKKN